VDEVYRTVSVLFREKNKRRTYGCTDLIAVVDSTPPHYPHDNAYDPDTNVLQEMKKGLRRDYERQLLKMEELQIKQAGATGQTQPQSEGTNRR
jgi:hypothetical protein